MSVFFLCILHAECDMILEVYQISEKNIKRNARRTRRTHVQKFPFNLVPLYAFL